MLEFLKRKKRDKARRQRYAFANGLLPSAFFCEPAWFMEILRVDNRAFLLYLWEKAGKTVGKGKKVAPGSWSCEFVTLEDSVSVALIAFPEPRAMTDPFFVAAVCRPAGPGQEQEGIARWFALEYNPQLGEFGGKAFFCERTGDGTHLNVAALAETTRDAFVAAVREMLEPEPDLRALQLPDFWDRLPDDQRASIPGPTSWPGPRTE